MPDKYHLSVFHEIQIEKQRKYCFYCNNFELGHESFFLLIFESSGNRDMGLKFLGSVRLPFLY